MRADVIKLERYRIIFNFSGHGHLGLTHAAVTGAMLLVLATGDDFLG
jgi:hypothetical protein